MNMTSIKTDTYRVEDTGYLIDIVTTETDYEAWLYHKDMAVKDLMFGCSKDQQPYEEFVHLVDFGDIYGYIEFYEKEHFM